MKRMRRSPALPKKPKPSTDVVLLGARTEDGAGMHVLRHREAELEIGVVRPLEHGKPVLGEIVKLTPRKESPRICDVEVQVPSPAGSVASDDVAAPQHAPDASAGPPQVATDSYRRNWDAIWSRPVKKREALN